MVKKQSKFLSLFLAVLMFIGSIFVGQPVDAAQYTMSFGARNSQVMIGNYGTHPRVIADTNAGRPLNGNGAFYQELYLNKQLVFCIEPWVLTTPGVTYNISGSANAKQNAWYSYATGRGFGSQSIQIGFWIMSEIGTVYGQGGTAGDAKAKEFKADYAAFLRDYGNNPTHPSFKTYQGTVFKSTDGGKHQTVLMFKKVQQPVPQGEARVRKTSEDNVVSGLEFELSGNGITKRATTNASGVASFGIVKAGTYTVKELNTPSRYNQPSSKTLTVTNGGASEVTFYNSLKKGNLALTKSMDPNYVSHVSGNAQYSLAGTEFSVKTLGGRLVGTIKVDANGKANTLTDLMPGTYVVQETKAGKGMKLDPNPHTITVKPGETARLSLTNRPMFDPISIRITKDGNSDEKLPGAVFEYQYFDGMYSKAELAGKTPKHKWRFVSNDNGVIEFKNEWYVGGDKLPIIDGTPQGYIGTYLIKEIEAPKGYERTTKEFIFQVEQVGQQTQLLNIEKKSNIVNTAQKMRFTLEKQDFINTNPNTIGKDRDFEGATYDIILREKGYKYDTNSVGDIVGTMTIKNGKAQSPDLYLGSYDIIEKSAPNGYNVNPVAVSVKGVPDDSGNKYTSKVSQVNRNDAQLVEFYNSKVDEYQKEINNDGGGRTIGKVNALNINLSESENQKVVTHEAHNFSRIKLTKHENGLDGEYPNVENGKPAEANIEFNVLYNGKVVDTIKTNKNGIGYSKILPTGKYTISQVTKAPNLLNVEDFEVDISDKPEDNFKLYTFELENNAVLKYLRIVKLDEETGKTVLQPNVTFKVYDDQNRIVRQTIDGNKVDEFKTDENGIAQLSSRIKTGTYYIKEIKAPTGYYLADPEKMYEFTLPEVGGAEIEIKEISNTPQKGQLTVEKTGPKLVGLEEKQVEGEDYKVTLPIFEDKPLEGTTWQLIAREDIISYDKQTKLYSKGDVVAEFTTGNDGTGVSKEVPLGKYTLKEVATPDKYALDKNEYDIEFTPQKQNIRVESQTAQKYNERKELQFEFNKTFETTKFFQYGYDALFGLYTAEDHTEYGITVPKGTLLDVVRIGKDSVHLEEPNDGDGQLSEATEEEVITRYEVYGLIKNRDIEEVVNHKQFNTEEEAIAYKEAMEAAQVEIEQSEESVEPEVEENNEATEPTETEHSEVAPQEQQIKYIIKAVETTVKEEQTNPDTSTNAKIKGTFKKLWLDGKFEVKELETSDVYRLSEQSLPIEFDFGKTEEKNNVVPAGEIHNELKRVSVKVSKIELTGDEKNIIPLEGARFKLVSVDPIKGEQTVGEYLTDKDGNITIKDLPYGKYYLQEVESIEGYFLNEKKYEFDTSFKPDGDMLDILIQNEKIPEIKTQNVAGSDKTDENKVVDPLEMITIQDYVYYNSLIVGEEYEVTGKLMFKDTNEPVLVDGEEVIKTVKFTPEEREGHVLVEFEVPGYVLRGKETVAFEKLFRDGREVTNHEDINDEPQTFRTTDPKIKTKLFQINTDESEVENNAAAQEKVFFVGQTIKLQDVVSVEDLIVGNEYELVMQLMIKQGEQKFMEEVTYRFIYNGEEKIIVEAPEFTVEENLKGQELVAFEKLYRIDKSGKAHLIVTHEDINDEDQTIRIAKPEVQTKFADINRDKEVNPTGKVEFVDHVEYKDLIIGKEYTAKLTVMNKETNEPLVDAEGNTYVGETTFIAEQTEGTVEVKTEIDVSVLRGKEIVAFEKLEYKGIEIAAHEDIEDEGQTIRVTDPEFGTQAQWEGNSKTVTWGKKTKLIDTVSYKDLVPGKVYTVVGEVILKGNTEADDKVITEKVYVEFTPETSEGTVNVEFDIDTSKFANSDYELVVFEELYQGTKDVAKKIVEEGETETNKKLAEHKDRNDKGQTVYVEKEPETGINDSVDKAPLYAGIATSLVAVLSLAAWVISKKRKHNN